MSQESQLPSLHLSATAVRNKAENVQSGGSVPMRPGTRQREKKRQTGNQGCHSARQNFAAATEDIALVRFRVLAVRVLVATVDQAVKSVEFWT